MILLVCLVTLVRAALAQHVKLDIPEVDQRVLSMLTQFSHWTHGPSPIASSVIATGEPLLATHAAFVMRDTTSSSCSYWLEEVSHQGYAAFNPNPAVYQVFRNVQDFGAKGDGVTDDTAAINAAISAGNRCAPGSCASTTTSPAIVYFPAGTYMISTPIIDYYYTQIIGNPNCMPTIRATAAYNSNGGLGLIEADPYGSGGTLDYGSTNVFWRQVRNLIIDTTLIPATSGATCIHWPSSQATSLQNIVFQMSTAAGNQHQGIFMESGSGGFMNDLVFNGGVFGASLGNQQYTMRNLTFNNCGTAINQIWDWGFTYQGLNINNCGTAVSISAGGSSAQSVGSVTIIDSVFSNTPVGIVTAFDSTSQPTTAGSLILENLQLNNVPTAVQGPSGTVLAGSSGSTTIAAWGEGHQYTPNGPTFFQGPISANNRPSSLVGGIAYYERSKPQYDQYPASSFLSARSAGAKGDGSTDDTSALQNAINTATSANQMLFLDHGDYKVTNTITIPPGARIVGESYSVILASGSLFSDMNNPQAVLRIGQAGEAGTVELSDFIVSTQGATAGAVLFEYNLASPSGSPSGLWDVHARIGGFAGSDLQAAQCPTTPTTVNTNCTAAYMTMHITPQSSGLYMENCWLWVADHDIEDASLTQISVYAGRGLLDQSVGPVWLVGTGVEHHQKYQYQFANAQNIFAGFIQTESAYYQPNPPASQPYTYVSSLSDPDFTNAEETTATSANSNVDGWGLRVVSSSDILVYGAGHYSFFNTYSTTCSNQGNGEACQGRIVDIENSSGISIYNLNTVGTTNMITVNGNDVAKYADNLDGFVDTIALFRSG